MLPDLLLNLLDHNIERLLHTTTVLPIAIKPTAERSHQRRRESLERTATARDKHLRHDRHVAFGSQPCATATIAVAV